MAGWRIKCAGHYFRYLPPLVTAVSSIVCSIKVSVASLESIVSVVSVVSVASVVSAVSVVSVVVVLAAHTLRVPGWPE